MSSEAYLRNRLRWALMSTALMAQRLRQEAARLPASWPERQELLDLAAAIVDDARVDLAELANHPGTGSGCPVAAGGDPERVTVYPPGGGP